MNSTIDLSIDKKFFSIQELKSKGLSQYKIGQLVEDGVLTKLNKKYYENLRYQGEESDFYYVGVYAPKGVICLLSAAAYYNLTTYIPDTVDVAIPRKARISTMPDWPQMHIHYYTDVGHELGTTRIQEGKNAFKIYDLEKTVADIVCYREKVGIAETREILITYLNRRDRNLNRLLEYAKRMKCDKTLRGYLEVLI